MRDRLLRYWRSERGLAAVEFAFVLPIILAMFLGLVELSQASGARAQIINMTSAAGDLVAQESSVSGSDLDSVFGAVNTMLFPNDTSQATITITSVIDGGTGKQPKVAWSCSRGRTPAAMTKGSAPSPALPSGLLAAGSGGSVIWSRVTYRYNSFLSYFLPTWTTWTNDFYLKPRRVLQIPLASAPSSPAVCNS
ncbi:MAG: pilus assembly protein [Alphaproteobacteria bacterium]|nr:pilus assembly protein [Alphaproteobacteria bacterium]